MRTGSCRRTHKNLYHLKKQHFAYVINFIAQSNISSVVQSDHVTFFEYVEFVKLLDYRLL